MEHNFSPEDNPYINAFGKLSIYSDNITTLSNKLMEVSSVVAPINFTSSISAVQNQLTGIASIATSLPSMEAYKSNYFSPLLESAREATLSLSSLAQSSAFDSVTKIVSNNYIDWYKEYGGRYAGIANEFNSQAIDISGDTLVSSIGLFEASSLVAQSSILKTTEYSLLSEQSVASFSYSTVGGIIGLQNLEVGAITDSYINFSDTYVDLTKSWQMDSSGYASLHPILSQSAASSYYIGTKAIETISIEKKESPKELLVEVEIEEKNSSSLEKYLPELDSGYYRMWKGAIEAYNSENSDKVRHFAVSIRELFTQILHNLAPDNEINSWTENPSMYHEGRPTRKARLYYICRNINQGNFKKFIKADVDATYEFLKLFQEGTHAVEVSFSPDQLRIIKSRAESSLKAILEIEFLSNRS